MQLIGDGGWWGVRTDIIAIACCLTIALSNAVEQVGWKHQDAVKVLEDRRKIKSAAFYQQKKKLIALRVKASAEA